MMIMKDYKFEKLLMYMYRYRYNESKNALGMNAPGLS